MREIKIHNTLSGRLEALKPRDAGQVGIYACGPTVYSRIHVGNARPFVVFALLKRFLEYEGYRVTLVENITDVNDKIYAAAREQGVPSVQLAEEMAAAYIADTDRLGLGRPDREPLASQTMESIVNLIKSLINRGFAYVVAGDVYFRVRSFGRYGALSNRKLDEMESQEPGDNKQDPLDFALWKAQKEGEDTAWDSPWGKGRPGWHIECSAMAEDYLGLDFDIHGGGSDLIFPHHENELAQTEAARGHPLARIWMHNGMVRFGEEKMAKSVGNIKLLGPLLDQYGRDAIVMYFLGGHYRQPLAFSADRLDEAASRLGRLAEFCRVAKRLGTGAAAEDTRWLDRRKVEFFTALADDFNTPKASAALFELVAEGNKRVEEGRYPSGSLALLEELLPCIGLESLLAQDLDVHDETAERLLAEREEARARRDFDAADCIRSEIEALGYEVRDTPRGAELVRKWSPP